MTKEEYLKECFDAYNSGRVSAEVYDAMILNAEEVCDEDEEE